MKKLKLLFMGTPMFASTVLQTIIDTRLYDVVGVFTKSDNVIGKKTYPSPVKLLAEKHNILVFTPDKLFPIFDEVKRLNPDIIITCAYGKIIPKIYLDNFYSINIHASLLPKYRGASPIEQSLLNGDQLTGITIIRLSTTLDGGPILLQHKTSILPTDNKTTLTEKLSRLAGKTVLAYLATRDTLPEIVQDETKVTFAPLITREEEYLNLAKSAREVIGKIRALSDKPGAKLEINNATITILMAVLTTKHSLPGQIIVSANELLIGTGDYFISVLKICQAGKKPMDIKSYLNGQKLLKTKL